VKKEIHPSAVNERLRKGAILLDVREPDERAEERIAGSLFIPLGELERRAGEVPTDREVICMCRSGRRSAKAQELLLRRNASSEVLNMQGGLLQWLKEGLPVER
jgi:rhodanese-related sulfurtransferase